MAPDTERRRPLGRGGANDQAADQIGSSVRRAADKAHRLARARDDRRRAARALDHLTELLDGPARPPRTPSTFGLTGAARTREWDRMARDDAGLTEHPNPWPVAERAAVLVRPRRQGGAR